MADQDKSIRVVRPLLWTALGTVAASGLATAAPDAGTSTADAVSASAIQLAAAGEGEGESASSEGEGEGATSEGEGGEGEGEGARGATEADFLAALGFMEGHIRAGMQLYETGDLEAARTHMGHPIEEKYGAVAETLSARGHGDLKGDIEALAAAAEAGKPIEDIRPLFASVAEKIDTVQAGSPGGTAAELRSLAILTRIAAEEYAVAVKGGEISNLHEYQDAWGFLRTVEDEARGFAESDDPAVAEAGQAILEEVGKLDAAFGDIQGGGEMRMEPSLLYGAAARMEIAALGVE